MRYIGLMSGTSMDGVDGVLVDFAPAAGDAPLRVLADHHVPMPAALAAELLALNTSGPDELHRAALAANALAELQAQAVAALLAASGTPAADVRAIGSHGQTVRHRPGLFDGIGYTLQLNQPALLAERTGIDVVADFRTRDVAAGGQGAPLVPAFHDAVFGGAAHPRAILNVGGIANLTLLSAEGRDVLGFDCGPGNALMDGWCLAHQGTRYDDRGAWAASGRVDDALLARLLGEPYFAAPPPKSTGRDLFHAEWLAAHMRAHAAAAGGMPAPVDAQATLLALTAQSAVDALRRHAPDTRELLVCGGGAFNDALMAALAARWPGLDVATTARAGLPPLHVESAAFAWLAQAFVERRPGNRPSVTGARGPRILGALYPA
jgi:anhydro-N-acetylmuramic acid kinase